jgi:hypothetical protein
MKFTPKTKAGLASAVLAAAGLGGMAWLSGAAPAPAPIAATKDALAVQDSFQPYGRAAIIPAVELVQAATPQGATPQNNYNIHMSAWYNNKHWWKKHAPIIGGAAGGGLIGGLAGGGKGALIGGAAGAGGGYLYKHLRDHNHHHGSAYRSGKATPQQPQHGR